MYVSMYQDVVLDYFFTKIRFQKRLRIYEYFL